MRKLSFKLFFLFIFLSKNGFATGDSLNYLTPKDSVILSIDFYGDKVFEHTLEQGQTLYSLARFYGLQPEELLFYNPHIQPETISIGAKLKVPMPNRALIRRPDRMRNAQTYVPVFHKIKRGETMYRLCNMFYKIPMDTLKRWNQMDSDVLKLHQLVYVGYMSTAGIPDSLRKNHSNHFWRRSYQLGKKFRGSAKGKTLRKDKGAAYWKKGKNQEELFALHRTAKPGSVILVQNPMTRRTVFVKVLGKIPEASYPPNIKLVVSEQAAKLLGARDPRFFVELQYWR